MHFKVCIVILAAAYIAYAGEQLLHIFDKNEEDVEDFISRVKRNSEENMEFQKEYLSHTMFCCNANAIRFGKKETTEILAEIKSKCEPKMKNMTDIKEQTFCYHECISGIMNMTDGNGNIVEDPEQLNKIKEFFLIDEEIILQNIASKCPTWSKEAVKNVQGEYECNPQALYFWFCSFDMRNLYCPEKLRRKDEGCDELRQNLTKTFQQ